MTGESARRRDFRFRTTAFDRALPSIILTTKPPAKWCAVNAIRHLNRAWAIRKPDPEMALFRTVTAEEEAARAVFLSLQRHHYPGAAKLNPLQHWHKLALDPFLDAVFKRKAILAPLYKTMSLRLDRTKQPLQLDVAFVHRHPPLDRQAWLPEPPLHILLKERGAFLDPAGMKEHLADPVVAKTILDNLHRRASVRTKLLYAAPNGVPEVKSPIEEALRQGQRTAFRLLKLFLLIDPHPQHQYLVQLGLDSFLRILALAPPDLDDLLKDAWPSHVSRLTTP